MNPIFNKVILFTDTDGFARFREETVELTEGKPQSRLSPLMASGGFQLRRSPVGFRSDFHCTDNPQWLFVLEGQMEIFCKTARRASLARASTFTRPMCCPQARRLTPRCTATGAAKWGPTNS